MQNEDLSRNHIPESSDRGTQSAFVELAQDFPRLEAAVLALPDRQRAAIVLRYLEEMSYPEIADELDVATATVRTLCFQGLRKLREALNS